MNSDTRNAGVSEQLLTPTYFIINIINFFIINSLYFFNNIQL
jgi:hypothetical protein